MKPLQQQRRHLAHGRYACLRSCGKVLFRQGQEAAVHTGEGIALFRNGEGDQLQGGAAEDGLQLFPVLGIGGVRPQRSGHRAHHGLFHIAVGHQRDQQAEVVIGAVGVLHDLIVKGLGGVEAALRQALLDEGLLEHGVKGAKEAAGTKVDPGGGLFRGVVHILPVKFRQGDPGGLPGGPVLNALVAQLHGDPP